MGGIENRRCDIETPFIRIDGIFATGHDEFVDLDSYRRQADEPWQRKVRPCLGCQPDNVISRIVEGIDSLSPGVNGRGKNKKDKKEASQT